MGALQTKRRPVSPARRKRIFKARDGICGYCGEAIGGHYETGHLPPLARGGARTTTAATPCRCTSSATGSRPSAASAGGKGDVHRIAKVRRVRIPQSDGWQRADGFPCLSGTSRALASTGGHLIQATDPPEPVLEGRVEASLDPRPQLRRDHWSVLVPIRERCEGGADLSSPRSARRAMPTSARRAEQAAVVRMARSAPPCRMPPSVAWPGQGSSGSR